MTLSLSRTVLFLLAGTALTACTTVEPVRPNFPTRVDPPPAQPPAAATPPISRPGESLPEARPSAPVQAAPLPSIGPARPAPSQPSAPPAMQTVTRTSVGGRVVDTAGPAKDYTVKPGDNLDAIARTLGTTRKQLADDNDLKAPYALRPGQVLKGPQSTRAKAYVVEQGDTLYAIARRFSVSAAAIAEANDREIEAPLATGQRLVLPEGFKDRGPTVTRTQVPVASATTSTLPPFSTPVTRPAPPIEEPPPARSSAPTVRTLVTGRVIDTTGKPKTYTVKKGDNLDSIARSLDTTRKDLADDNDLKPPYALQPGQKLKGPPVKAKAYVAGQGDTMALIAKRFNVTQRALAETNGLRVGASIRPGREVVLPAGYRDRGPIREEVAPPPPPRVVVQPPAAPPVTQPPAQSRPAPSVAPPPPQRPAPPPQRPVQPPPSATPPVINPPAAVGTPTDAQISSFGRGRFVWPLRGDVLSGFGPKGTGQRNDGVNIRTPQGEAVRAAAAGDVVYAGDQVPGFGNLVLIKHTDGWVTAYGHLARVDVKMQQKVVQGQQIGQAGATGGVSEPQLHFEVRYAPTPQDRARPIDPMLVLPK